MSARSRQFRPEHIASRAPASATSPEPAFRADRHSGDVWGLFGLRLTCESRVDGDPPRQLVHLPKHILHRSTQVQRVGH